VHSSKYRLHALHETLLAALISAGRCGPGGDLVATCAGTLFKLRGSLPEQVTDNRHLAVAFCPSDGKRPHLKGAAVPVAGFRGDVSEQPRTHNVFFTLEVDKALS
jgi:hypothetical protein